MLSPEMTGCSARWDTFHLLEFQGAAFFCPRLPDAEAGLLPALRYNNRRLCKIYTTPADFFKARGPAQVAPALIQPLGERYVVDGLLEHLMRDLRSVFPCHLPVEIGKFLAAGMVRTGLASR